MNGYKAFYRGKSCEIYADSSYAAQLAAAEIFKAQIPKQARLKVHEITVMLCETADGGQVTHVPLD